MNLAPGMRARTEILNPGGTISTRSWSNGVVRSAEATSTLTGTSPFGNSAAEKRVAQSKTNAPVSNVPKTAADPYLNCRRELKGSLLILPQSENTVSYDG